jgi:hypothetical protein
MIRVRTFTLVAGALLLKLGSTQAHACAACFGKSDSAMAQGMNMGIFALLLVITCVLAGVASFFVYIGRKEAEFQENHTDLAEQISQSRTNA